MSERTLGLTPTTADARERPGLYVAGVGAVVELTGLVWDAVRHARDPGLAAHEELFSFADPSHVLLMLGIALAAAGLAFELISATSTKAGRLRREGLSLGIALVALLAANAGVALVSTSVAPADEHSHVAAAVANDAVSRQLADTVRARGVSAALDQLTALADKDPAVFRRAHDLAHLVGAVAVTVQPDVSRVVRDCRDTFLYGCYHGALAAYFSAKGHTRPADVVGVCPADISPLLRFQCLHGLGHGVLANLEYDLFRSLVYCDALANEFDRRSCYGGVFMENIVVAIDQVAGRAEGDRAEARPFLRADDAQYPCDVVAEKYRGSCYQLQTSGMLLYNARDYARTAAACDAAPAAHIGICFESLGRDVSGDVLRDDAKAIAICEGLPSRNRAGCFVGAVRNLLDAPERAVPFCRQVPEHGKSACYAAAGGQLSLNYAAGDPRRATACAQAESAYVRVCQEEIDRR